MANDNKKKLKFDASPEELRAFYQKLKDEFSLEDLKAFQVAEKDRVLFSQVVETLEDMVRQARANQG